MRATRGDFTTPGTDSPFRTRSVAENRARWAEMRSGELADGAAVLRAKIDMASPNINLRDPAMYRIKHATHHTTGDAWCIYPMYTFAHPIEDALENITHSICTLEFEDQRPFYDWLLEHLARLGLLAHAAAQAVRIRAPEHQLRHDQQAQAARRWSTKAIVSGWDDPRMPTIFGLRRRGYTPASLRLMAERTGASKTNIWVGMDVLDGALRDDLEGQAPRAMAVIDPLKLELTNWAEVFGNAAHLEPCQRAGASAAARTRPTQLRPRARASGSSATTSPRRRPRASSGSFPATRCA